MFSTRRTPQHYTETTVPAHTRTHRGFFYRNRPRVTTQTVPVTTTTRKRGFFHSSRPRTTTTTVPRRTGFFHRTNPNRVAGGFKAALSNPNTTSTGRHNAKHELNMMGRGREAHVPLSTRIKHMFGIRSHHRRAVVV